MSATLVQLNFSLDVTAEEYEAAVTPLAEAFAALNGLRWKIWMVNPDAREAGGIYLFDDGASVGEFLDSPLAAQVKSHPAIRNLSAKVFDVMDELTAVTRGPIDPAVRASR
jgi:hypothetical protein